MRGGVLPSEISPRRMGVAQKMAENDKGEAAEARREDVSQRDSSMRVSMVKRRQTERKRMWLDEQI